MLDLTESAATALESPIQKSTPYLKIETTTGVVVNVTDDGMLAGSLTISNQCSEGSDITLGSAYIGELDVTLLPSAVSGITRSAMQGANVTAFLDYSDMTIQMGVYTVDEAEWSASGIALTCYDNMSKLTGSYTGGELRGNAYYLLDYACSVCGVTFGMTSAQVAQFPNATEDIQAYGDADISEWRDFIGWVAQTLCAFATMDGYGNLVIREYGYTSVDTLDSTRRSDGSKFSSFATRYTGVSYVNIDDQTSVYIGLAPDDALTMNLGQNPFLQYGLDAKKTRIATAIITELAKGAWVPFEVELPFIPPVYELGDCITFTERFAGTSSTVCVMGYEWTSHKGLRLVGYGSDPALATGNSKTDKELSGLLSRVSKDTVQYYPFVNVQGYTIGTDVAVLSINYASTQDGTVEFHCNIDLEAVGNVTTTTDTKTYHRTQLHVYYELNGTILEGEPLDSYTDGWHVLHLFRPLGVSEGQTNEIRVILTATDGVINIGVGCIRAMVSGRCLAANDAEWRGTQSFFEEMPLSLLGILMAGYTDSLSTSLETPVSQGVTESFSYSLLGSLSVGFTASPGGSDWSMSTNNVTMTSGIVYENSAFHASENGEIVTDEFGTDAMIDGIASFLCTDTGTVTIECDFGDGYKQWNGSGWVTSTGGNAPDILNALTTAQWALGYTDSIVLKISMTSGAYIYALAVEYTDDWS